MILCVCVWVELNVATLSDQQLPFAMKKLIDGSLFQSRTQMLAEKLKLKLKPDKFFMRKPSQNYRVSPKYGVTQFDLQPDISEHTPP